jgi:hypothetical protein
LANGLSQMRRKENRWQNFKTDSDTVNKSQNLGIKEHKYMTVTLNSRMRQTDNTELVKEATKFLEQKF